MNLKPKVTKNCKICSKQMLLCPSLAKTKTVCSPECNLVDMKNRKPFLGKKHRQETKNKISKTKTGVRLINKRISTYFGERHHWFGRNCTGENNPTYKKDRSTLKRIGDVNRDRRSSAYVTWRKQVWLRDNFTCKIANPDCAGRIEAHHILGWTQYPELRYQLNNGITLCHAHHPRKRAEEKRLIPTFQELVSVSN